MDVLVDRKIVQKLHSLGFDQAFIQRITGRCQSFVSKWISRSSWLRKQGSGRPSKITSDVSSIIKSIAYNTYTDCGGSLNSIRHKLKDMGYSLSRSTISKHLNRQTWGKLKSQPCMSTLSSKAIEKRLNFCKDLISKKRNFKEFSKSILFTDEKYFSISHKPNKQNHKIRTLEEILPFKEFPSRQKGLLVAGGISFNGKTKLLIIKDTVNKDNYIEILKAYEEEFSRHSNLKVLMQDNAPPHKAKKVTEYIKTNFPLVFDWPPYSPDLNPIEKAWRILQDMVSSQNPKTLKEMEEIVLQSWEKINLKKIQALCLSFESKVNEVIRKNGLR